MSLTLISSPRFADHVTPPGHPERVERADVLEVVADRWRGRNGSVVAPRAATREELARVHHDAYLDSLEATRGRAVMLDGDTFTSPQSLEVAALAAGATLTGLESILHVDTGAGDDRTVEQRDRSARLKSGTTAGDGAAAPRRALALVRPPGHHAEAERAMGFCLYNNVAVAAAAALAAGIERVAIVDFDVHHGNGTQHSFYRDPRVLFISTHQYPFYPGTGAATETGEGEGRGFTVNIPLEGGCTDGDYVLVFDRVIVPVLDEFAPALLLVSAGFDAHERDPLAHMRMSAAGFGALAARTAGIADRHARGRLLLVTEGGYDLPAFSASLDAVVHVLAGEPVAERDLAGATGRGAAAVEVVRAAQAGRWHAL
jgi:acetoin utilization deacetylase AcuC-like enzyme